MLHKLFRSLIKTALHRCKHQPRAPGPGRANFGQVGLSPNLEVNKKRIREAYGNSADLVLRELKVGAQKKISVLIVHIDGLVDKELVSKTIIQPLTQLQLSRTSSKQAYADFKNRFITNSDVKEVSSLDQFLTYVAGGNCGVLVDGVSQGLVCAAHGWEQRTVDEPATEPTIRGSKEGFVETLRTNTSLLRRRIKDPRLWIEEHDIGNISKTTVAIAYVCGIVNNEVLQEVRSRLKRIDADSIQESGQLEEYIEDAPFSPFPTILRTERLDKVVGALLEGRIAIMTDGTPFVLIVPVTFAMFLTSPEDYFERHYIGSVLRFIRYFSFILSLTLPSLYVAITTFHQETLPTTLVFSIAAQRERIPFPAVVEALLMETIFEVLREAAVHLPPVIGPAVSIIGGLVIGDAAIRAGLVSPAMVVVVATTGIASFATPVFSLAIGARLLRFVMVIVAASLGFFGIVAGVFALFIHLTCLRSFGVPFMEPFAPQNISDLKDTLLRSPWWAMDTRPFLVARKNFIRQAPNLKPTRHSSNKSVRRLQGGHKK